MKTWFDAIHTGILFYLQYAVIAFIPAGMLSCILRKRLNPIRFLAEQLFAFYLCCLLAVAFLPLPTMEAAAELRYRAQLIPMYCVYDQLRHFTVSGALGVAFNIVMTVPFGIYLRYVCRWDVKSIVLAGLGLTLFIEIGQLTGLFFLYHGSYRLFDMDDILQNTLGAYLGCRAVMPAEAKLPRIAAFDTVLLPGRPHMA